MASRNGNVKLAPYLLKHGADPEKSQPIDSLIMWAMVGSIEMARKVLSWDPDVMDNLSASFLKRLRATAKAAAPDALILGEQWGDASEWLLGSEADSVMNYRFRRAVIGLINGSTADLDGSIDKGLPEIHNRILYVYYPIFDEALPCLDKLEVVGKLVAELVATRHVVLVHCRMGFNRSNLVIATALTYLGLTGAEAVDHLQRVRPGALYNETFADHVRTLPCRGARPRE